MSGGSSRPVRALRVRMTTMGFANSKGGAGRRPRRGASCHRGTTAIAMLLCVALFAGGPSPVAAAGSVANAVTMPDYRKAASFYPTQIQATGSGTETNPAPQPVQETQADRDARVATVHISPRNVTVHCGDIVALVATAQDEAGNPVGGIDFAWHAHDVESGEAVALSAPGEFIPREPGTYVIAAEAAGRRGQATVTAVDMENAGSPQPQLAVAPEGTADGKNQLPLAAEPGTEVGEEPRWEEPRWDETTEEALIEPVNRRGSNVLENLITQFGPAFSEQQWQSLLRPRERGTTNFRLSAPLIDLAGRGLDVSLNLNYNSLLWHRIGDQMRFAPQLDDDWPGPGWTLGLGKVYGRVLFDGDGTRHLLSGRADEVGHTTDGTLISCSFVVTRTQCRYPDGTAIDFNHYTTFGFRYPTQITDANGNYIAITYRDVSQQSKLPAGRRVGPAIATISDTLGRTITFHYEPEVETADDYSGVLTAITAPGLNGETRTLARFNWVRRPLEPGFSSDVPPHPRTPRDIRLLRAIFYPGTKTGYWFGEEDSYSSYGMLATVREQREMGFSGGSLTEQGVIAPGRTTRQRTYNYPLQANNSLVEPPTYTTLTETWEGMTTDPAVTRYGVTRGAVAGSGERWQRVDTTYPDGSRHSYLEEGQKPVLDEVYAPNGGLLQRTRTAWELGHNSSPRPTRRETTDERQQVVAQEFSYGPYNQVTERREYDYDGSLARRTAMEYEEDPAYIDRHILNLPKVIEVYGAKGASAASRTELAYDGHPLAKVPGVVHHSQEFNPDAPLREIPRSCEVKCPPCPPGTPDCPFDPDECWEECTEARWEPQYDPRTEYRGHLTQITRYANAAERAEPIVETRRYDLVGNMVSSTAGSQHTTFAYDEHTQYAYPTSQTTGASAAESGPRVTVAATYDFHTGVPRSVTDANGRTTVTEWSPASLRPDRVVHPTGAATTFDYDDDNSSVTVSTAAAAADESPGPHGTTWLNGLRRPVRQATLAAGGGWDVVEIRYDERGRPVRQSQPVRRTGGAGSWAEPEWWNETGYDALGRVTTVQRADGSTVETVYNEDGRPAGATDEPGATVRTTDPWGRWRWARNDSLGRLVEVVEPAPGGDGSLQGAGNHTTTYDYNALGLLAAVHQGEQERVFLYDALGRLRRQSLPEKLRTLNDEGRYVGADGRWSDAFTYDERSNVTSHTDARGVKAVYDYGDDPLDRLQRVSYDVSGFGDSEFRISPSGDVRFSYVATGDLTRVARATIDSVGAETHRYDDAEGRLSSTSLELDSWPAHPLVVDYTYDSLSRVTDLRYPAEYEVGEQQRRLIHHDYDGAGRPQGIRLDGVNVASDIVYNALGVPVSLSVGADGPMQVLEAYGYDPATGLLTDQSVRRGDTKLLDLSYDFLRTGETGRSGQLTRLVDNLDDQKSRSYHYDALGRLAKATGGPAPSPRWTQDYDYDGYGNRTGVRADGTAANGEPIPADGPARLDYNATTNRISTDGYTYDAAGNLTRGQQNGVWHRYQYDAAGRLASVMDDSGAALELYAYGVGRQRVWTDHRAGPVARTYYSWLGDQLLSEYHKSRQQDQDGDDTNNEDDKGTGKNKKKDKEKDKEKDKNKGKGRNNRNGKNQGKGPAPSPKDGTAGPRWVRSNVYLGERLLASLEPSAEHGRNVVRYHHPDRLGTRLITNASAPDLGEQTTLPFGVSLDAESTANVNPRFTSYYRSGTTGLDYANNRYYHSEHGRFTQVDPLGLDAATLSRPPSLNLYSYVENDPVNAIDPSGLRTRIDSDAQIHCQEGTGCSGSETIVVIGCYSCLSAPVSGPKRGLGEHSRALQPGDLASGGSTASMSEGGSGTRARSMSLHEAIYRVLGGREPLPTKPPLTLSKLYADARSRFILTNSTAPGLLAPPGLGFLTGRAVAQRLGTLTAVEAAKIAMSGASTQGMGGVLYTSGAVTVSANFLGVSLAYEGGVLVGSVMGALLFD